MRLYLLAALALMGVLLASAAHAQSSPLMGNGDAHGMMGGHIMMGRQRRTGQMLGGHMTGGHMTGGHMGMRGVMVAHHAGAASAAAQSSAAGEAQAEDEAQDPAQTGAPPSFLVALQSADPQRGRQLVVSRGCIGCHSLNPRQRMVGPTWYNLAESAETRVPGQSAAVYLYTSIVHPNAYVAPGYQSDIMVQAYGQVLGEDKLADLVSYLLTLREQE